MPETQFLRREPKHVGGHVDGIITWRSISSGPDSNAALVLDVGGQLVNDNIRSIDPRSYS